MVPIGLALEAAAPLGHEDPFSGSTGWVDRYGLQEVTQFRGAEMIAEKWDLSREAMEAFAFESHRRAVVAIDEGRFANEVVPVINDLADRGMLDNVLVVMMSEFGRTPLINSRLGRDHWPDCWSIALAGCGIKRGAIIGETTKDGAFVNGEGYDIGHLFHTIFTLLGINPRKTRYRHKGQKLAIAHDDCEPIKEVML